VVEENVDISTNLQLGMCMQVPRGYSASKVILLMARPMHISSQIKECG
jgi:hypothetical protein